MAKKSVVQPQDKYVLRLPDGLRDRIKAEAEAENRSMNAEIISVLEKWYRSLLDEMRDTSDTLSASTDAIARRDQKITQLVEMVTRQSALVAQQNEMIGRLLKRLGALEE